ncbi:ATP-grasp domain-containing protein [Ilumatobacter sp.]|uniref:ATP-grasp domain-containing protein n=1 Tax=Ilumatobacter sp. TaxID=1967498 RepID=UPI003B526056
MLGLVTAEVAAHLDPDLEPLASAMRDRLGGDRVEVVAWDDLGVDWERFDVAVVRSTWDYTDRLAEFLDWTDRVAERTRLLNSPDAIRWSSDKRYLAELAAADVAIPSTAFVAPGESAPTVEGVHVVKPTVGAGADGARRCEPDEVADHVALLHARGRTAIVQPYLELLDERGETGLCFARIGGRLELVNAFGKGAILTTTEVEREGDLFAKERIDPRVPSGSEVELAERALGCRAVTDLDDVFFARVDVAPMRAASGEESFVVVELELIEPSFFFATGPSSLERFADALASTVESADARPAAGS